MVDEHKKTPLEEAREKAALYLEMSYKASSSEADKFRAKARQWSLLADELEDLIKKTEMGR
jgi:hypothetical protein